MVALEREGSVNRCVEMKYHYVVIRGEYEEEEESRASTEHLDAPLTLKGIGNLWPRKAKATLYKLRKLTTVYPNDPTKNSYIAMGWSFWKYNNKGIFQIRWFFFSPKCISETSSLVKWKPKDGTDQNQVMDHEFIYIFDLPSLNLFQLYICSGGEKQVISVLKINHE